MTAETDIVARSFRIRKFECTFRRVRQSLLFVYNTINNYIYFFRVSIDRPTNFSFVKVRPYSVKFDKLSTISMASKTINPNGTR